MIATCTATPVNGSDASFRAWGGGLSGAITSAGLVRVWSGIDWNTAAVPNQGWQIVGHEVFRFSDVWQGEAPVYLRIGYGAGSDADYPRITVQIGSEVAADGSLSGLVTPVSDLALAYYGLTYLTYTCYVLLSPERFGIVFYPSGAAARAQCWVERWRRSGGLTPGGVTLLASNGGNVFTLSSSLDYSALTTTSRTQDCAAAVQPLGATTGLDGSSLTLYPIRTWDGRREVGPLLSVLAYFQGDAATGDMLSVLCWDGVRRVYKAQGVPWNSVLLREPVQSRQCCLALLWEGVATSALTCEAPASPYFVSPVSPVAGRIWPRRTR